MPFDPLEMRQVGKTDLKTNLFALGAANLGGWTRKTSDEESEGVLDAAWAEGVRTFDTAPIYGLGMSEERLGKYLADKPRDSFVISTKVGRILEDDPDQAPLSGGREFWQGAPSRIWHFDYSYDGVMRSVEDSLERTGLGYFDQLLIHDADDHVEEAMDGAYKALDKLRSEGSVKAIGAGMNSNPVPKLMAEKLDVDVFMLAGRYTLLDHSALTELLPTCLERGVTISNGGVYNSGVLTNPGPGAWFDYAPLDDKWRETVLARGLREYKDHETGEYWLNRVMAIKAVCDRHNVLVRDAAVQFAAAHPSISNLAIGSGRPERFIENANALRVNIPDDLWAELKHEQLIHEEAPVPAEAK